MLTKAFTLRSFHTALQTWQRPTLPRLKTKYHRRWGVSRPSSEWDRVQPPRHNHQVDEAVKKLCSLTLRTLACARAAPRGRANGAGRLRPWARNTTCIPPKHEQTIFWSLTLAWCSNTDHQRTRPSFEGRNVGPPRRSPRAFREKCAPGRETVRSALLNESVQADRAISTGKLHTLLRFHTRPINVVVFHGSQGEIVSRWVSRLDAFSGYPVRT